MNPPAPNTTNMFLVSSNGDGLAMLRPPVGRISKEEAANLAAWLLVMARTDRNTFEALVEAIENS